jgi:hypothetical protein
MPSLDACAHPTPSSPGGVEGVSGDTSPGPASQQLALTIEAQTAQADPPVKGGEAAEGHP